MKWHELIARLVQEGGGTLPVAKAMRAESFQGTLHKICAGRVDHPSRPSAERIAAHFDIPVDALYDDATATRIFDDRFGEAGALGASPAKPTTTAAAPSQADLEGELRQALEVVRARLVDAYGDDSVRAAEALSLLAMTPDSDRAFKNAIAALIPTHGEESPLNSVAPGDIARPVSHSAPQTGLASPPLVGGKTQRGVWNEKRVSGVVDRTDQPTTYRRPGTPASKKAGKK